MYRELTIASTVPEAKLKRAFKTGKLSLSAAELKGSGSVLHLHPGSFDKALKARKRVRLEITRHEIKKRATSEPKEDLSGAPSGEGLQVC
ncbi:hypothetical protein PF001_g20765 [Phytophthora fragariae]|uniref:Uncharacterized protein n=1 Tax=Phytophthora fragariae TaxID=53985 RepID=A0A6A4CJR8_9STRA|nr:hypothetical protein PF001_g20765 [Phytophthora fragariae]